MLPVMIACDWVELVRHDDSPGRGVTCVQSWVTGRILRREQRLEIVVSHICMEDITKARTRASFCCEDALKAGHSESG